MFRNDFQGASHFEIFNPSVKDPLSNYKVTGSSGIQKIYDKDIKSSVYQLEGTPTTTKITLPKDTRQGLSLIQRILVIQVFVKPNSEFSLEIGITDLTENRRNLSFSTSHKELSAQPLSARIPIKHLNRAQWTNLVFDMTMLVNEIWKNQTFKTIDLISICANCRLRKTFTVRNLPNVDPESNCLVFDELSSAVDFPEGTESKIQIFSINPAVNDSLNNSMNSQLDSPTSNGQKTSKSSNVFKIAFGSKVAKTGPPSAQGSANQRKQSLTNSSSNTSQLSQNGDPLDINLNNSLKNNQISPLSMSSRDLTNRRSSATSNLHLTDKSNIPDSSKTPASTKTASNPARIDSAQENKSSNSPRKTTWNQQRSAKSTTNLASKKQPVPDNNSLNGSTGSTSNRSTSGKPTSTHDSQVSKDSTAASPNASNDSNKLNELLTTQTKVPYPPPQHTRPASSRTRLRSGLKSAVNNNNVKGNQPMKANQTEVLKPLTNGIKNSSQESTSSMNNDSLPQLSSNLNYVDLDESINDIIQVLRSNNNSSSATKSSFMPVSDAVSSNSSNLQKAPSTSNLNFNEVTNLDDSTRTIVYTFASKPKPVTNAKDASSNNNTTGSNTNNNSSVNNSNANTSKNEYDFRKYSSASNSAAIASNKPQNMPQNNQAASNSNGASYNKTPANFYDITKDSLNFVDERAKNNNNYSSNNADVMDSFEAQMLQVMKAEMDADSGSKNTAKQASGGSGASRKATTAASKTASNGSAAAYHDSGVSSGISAASGASKKSAIGASGSSKANGLVASEANLKLVPTSPDIGYLEEALQRESSGLQSPLSDRTTSEKYNFDAMTSSIEDTTTSLSKKTVSRKGRADEANNYQEEMNMSMLSNQPAKSINLKDLPAKYSPFNQHQNGSAKMNKSPITEEPSQYDDSQADIDEIISDSDEEVDLLFDPALNCYYDPKTGTYYELNMS